jgi:hypothetical protein
VPDRPFLTPNTPPVWFSGIPFAHLNNPLLVPILHAPAESFASDTDSDSGAEVLFEAAERGGEGLWAGGSLGIVTGFQTRDNSARVTWVGGIELFSDAYAKKSLPSCVNQPSRYCNVPNSYSYSFFFLSGAKSGNEQFALDIATWTFQESLVLRIDSTAHHLVNETAPREHYTINENIVRHCHSQPMNYYCNLLTLTTGLRRAYLPVPPQARMVTLLRTGRYPGRVHNARPAHPHCASSRLREPRPIQHLIPRSRQTRCVQIRPGPSSSWLDDAQVDNDGTNCPTATRWVSAFLERGVAVLRGRDQYQRRLFDFFGAVVGGRT